MLRRIGIIAGVAILALGLVFYGLAFWPLRDPHPTVSPAHGTLAIRDVTVYPAPDEAPLDHATLLVRDGLIIAIGNAIQVPNDAEIITCPHCVVTAGFWNTHVHFSEDKWSFADWKSASDLNAQLADMLTSRGFTTVVDTGSNLRNTIPLRRRIESGELRGPKIYTAGTAQYPPNGVPFYVRESMPSWMLRLLPQPATPAEAAQVAERNIAQGADILKLFTGSYVTRGTVLPMPEDTAAAAVAVAHGHGQLAFAHPSDLAGVLVALHSGVDVLAHAPDTPDGIDGAVLQSLVDRHMAMIPTLKMFATTVTKQPSYLDPIYAEVRQFHALGGVLLFGTDVGYMRDYSTEDEFVALQKSGLNAADILRMLTLAPATLFGTQTSRGTIAVGRAADLVVLSDDPASDVTAYSKVAYTIRDGRIIYRRAIGGRSAP
jgi:imidazolonepropionase-like amidohydrolase